MVNLKANLAIFAFAILVFLSGPAYAADSLYRPNVFFLGITADQGQYSAGANITIETTIVNEEASPQANMTLYYRLNRKNDSALVFSGSDGLELGSREVRTVKKIIQVPPMIVPGKYEISVELVSASGTPVSSIVQVVSIDAGANPLGGVLFKEGEFYLKVPLTQTIADGITETKTKYMYGLVGDTIPKGNPISAHFMLYNPGKIGLNLTVRLEVIASYNKPNQISEPKAIEQKLGFMETGGNKKASINFSIDSPGTYSVILAVYSNGVFLCQKEIRAVVSGEDGTILGVKNRQDTYKKGESVNVGVSFVGPADKSLVEGAYIQLNVKSSGKEIKTLRNSILLLSTNPGATEFSFDAPEELNNYDLEIKLGKGTEVFDFVAQSYSPMGPNMTITPDGRIIPTGQSGCYDDGICAESEATQGDCIDCRPMNKTTERQEFEKFEFYKNLSFVLLGIILLLLIVVWWYKR